MENNRQSLPSGRGLTLIVIVLGIAITVGSAVLIGVIISRLHRPAPSALAACQALNLPSLKAAHLLGTTLRGDGALMLSFDAVDHSDLVMWDPFTCKVVLRLRINKQ